MEKFLVFKILFVILRFFFVTKFVVGAIPTTPFAFAVIFALVTYRLCSRKFMLFRSSHFLLCSIMFITNINIMKSHNIPIRIKAIISALLIIIAFLFSKPSECNLWRNATMPKPKSNCVSEGIAQVVVHTLVLRNDHPLDFLVPNQVLFSGLNYLWNHNIGVLDYFCVHQCSGRTSQTLED